MAETTEISWATATFNPWRGCAKVAPGCANCYAEKEAKRFPANRGIWGPDGTRVKASESMWREPFKWNEAAEKAGERRKVFCASLADIFEEYAGQIVDHKRQLLSHQPGSRGELVAAGDSIYTRHRHYSLPPNTVLHQDFVPTHLSDLRQDLFTIIDTTPQLDWLLLTKRPENVRRMLMPWLRDRMGAGIESPDDAWQQGLPVKNLWLGTSISEQETADANMPHLLACRALAPVLFASYEPALGPVDFRHFCDGPCPNCGKRRDPVGLRGSTDESFSYYCQSKTCRDQYPLPQLDWLIIGVESNGPRVGRLGSFASEADWIENAVATVRQCQAAGVAVFCKQIPVNGRVEHDIANFPEPLRVREYPSKEAAHA